MRKNLLLLFTTLSFFIFKSNLSYCQTTLAAGDIAFTGLNETASTVNGAASNRDFSFILLKEISSGTVIYFTDFGWRSDSPAFQTALPCPSQPSGSGSVTDGVLKWTATSNMTYGTQVLVRCQYAPTTNIGSVVGFQATYNSTLPASTALQYVTMSTVGETVFAYQGSLSNPSLIAGLNTSSTGWATSLLNCDYNSAPSTLPTALSTNNYAFTLTPESGIANMQLKSTIVIPSTAADARTAIANKSNWNFSASTPYLMPPANPLPVRLVSLNARTIGESRVLLNWKTAEAVNFSGFQVEKSLDAKTFAMIAEISYRSGLDEYSYTDNTKLNHAGPFYYRLKLKDLDDSFAYSQILSIDSKNINVISFSAYPNPFIHQIEVLTEANDNKNVSVTLTNSNGANMLSRNVIVKNNKITLEIDDKLPAGIYILSVNSDMGIQKMKMVKNL